MTRPYGVIIEDDIDTQDIFANILDLCGVNCDVIPSGTQAMDFLEEQNIPDIMLIDMHLPGANGVEIVQFIRNYEIFDNTIVIVISADHMMSSSVDDLVDAVILKPVDIWALRTVIERLLASRFS